MTVLSATGMSNRRLLGYSMAPAAIVAVIVAWLSLGLAPQGVAEVAKIFNQQDAMTEFDTLVPGRFQAMKDGSRVTYTEGLSDDRGQLAGVFISEKRMQRQVEGEKPKQSGITVLVAEKGRQVIQADGSRYLIPRTVTATTAIPARPTTVPPSTRPTACCCPSPASAPRSASARRCPPAS